MKIQRNVSISGKNTEHLQTDAKNFRRPRWSGAEVGQSCTSRYLKIKFLKAYHYIFIFDKKEHQLANIGFRTNEDEPSKVWYTGLAFYLYLAWIPHL